MCSAFAVSIKEGLDMAVGCGMRKYHKSLYTQFFDKKRNIQYRLEAMGELCGECLS